MVLPSRPFVVASVVLFRFLVLRMVSRKRTSWPTQLENHGGLLAAYLLRSSSALREMVLGSVANRLVVVQRVFRVGPTVFGRFQQ